MEQLKRLEELTDRLRLTNSPKEKREILLMYPDLKDTLYWIYNPYVKFFVTGKTVKKFMALKDKKGMIFSTLNLIDLMTTLASRTVTGNDALMSCEYLIYRNKEHEDIILRALSKDLECGINIRTINSAFPDLIPMFEVPLANKYNPDKHDIFDGHWLLSRKLDGIRCLAFIEQTNINFMTREGIEIKTLDKIKQELLSKWEFTYPIILDGELCIFRDGQEYFNEISGLWNRKDYTIDSPMFYVFDMYSIDEFKQGFSYENYVSKLHKLTSVFKGYKYIRYLEHIPLTKDIEFIIPEGWEGFIARKVEDTLFKRSNQLLKIKDFIDEEFKVISLKESEMLIDGKKVPIVGSFDIDYKGFKVNIGSGLSQSQRIQWLQNPKEILNKVVTIRYTSESKDKQGNLSLRFPRFKGIYTKYSEEDMF